MSRAEGGRPRPCVWARKDQLQHARTRGGLLCAMYPDTNGRADLEPLYDQDAIDRLTADRDSWMQQASDRAQDALDLVAAERKHWRTMLSPQHVFRGSCPDAQNWHDRDPECPACRALGDWTA